MQTAFRCPRLSTAFAGLPAYRRCNYRARSTLTHASGMELAGFSRWLERCNRQSDQELVPFTIDGSVLGYVTPTLLTRLAALDAFRVRMLRLGYDRSLYGPGRCHLGPKASGGSKCPPPPYSVTCMCRAGHRHWCDVCAAPG